MSVSSLSVYKNLESDTSGKTSRTYTVSTNEVIYDPNYDFHLWRKPSFNFYKLSLKQFVNCFGQYREYSIEQLKTWINMPKESTLALGKWEKTYLVALLICKSQSKLKTSGCNSCTEQLKNYKIQITVFISAESLRKLPYKQNPPASNMSYDEYFGEWWLSKFGQIRARETWWNMFWANRLKIRTNVQKHVKSCNICSQINSIYGRLSSCTLFIPLLR